MKVCEHINQEVVEVDAGLTATYDPKTLLERVCLDCESVMENDCED